MCNSNLIQILETLYCDKEIEKSDAAEHFNKMSLISIISVENADGFVEWDILEFGGIFTTIVPQEVIEQNRIDVLCRNVRMILF